MKLLTGLCLAVIATCQIGQADAQTTVDYYHTDALGSVVAMSDASGAVVERNEYEPFGADLSGLKDGPGYTGHVADAVTGLNYMQQRYYDASIGRFLSVDPVSALSGDPGHMNRYGYTYGNPYRFTDPDGRAGCSTGTRIACGGMLTQIRREVARVVAREVAKSIRNAANAAKTEVKNALSKNTFSAQVGVGGSIAAPLNSKAPMAGSLAVTGSVNVGVNSHGQIYLTASGAPMLGQGGGATGGVQYGAGFAEGGPSPKGFSTSTNHHVEGTLSIPEVPVALGGSYDWNTQGRSAGYGSARFSLGQMMFYGGGEQVNYTLTLNNPPGASSEE